ncbi:Ig-like domain-containing protein, partial [Desulfosarcina sp. OttesenSCG-928-G17]|nr:Ig-like domain-containing protein [Desulfosarcina sp. OttesenSCG-928-G17]
MTQETLNSISSTSSNSLPMICQVERSQVTAMFRDANDLVIRLSNGSTTRIDNFFAKNGVTDNILVLQESDGSLWQVLFVQESGQTVMAGYAPYEADAALSENLPAAWDAVADSDDTQSGYSVEIVSYTDNVGPQQGEFSPGTETDDTTPRLNGVATGLQPGDQIWIYDGEIFLGIAQVDAYGNWTFDVPELSGGRHVFAARIVTAEGFGTNAVGNLVLDVDTGSSSGLPLPFWIIAGLGAAGVIGAIIHHNRSDDDDPKPPSERAAITHAEDNVAPEIGTVLSGGITNDDTLELHGTVSSSLNPGQSVVILRDGVEVGRVSAEDLNGSLEWAFTDNRLAEAGDGTYTYTACVVGANNMASPESDAFTVTLDTTAPIDGYTIAIVDYTDDVAPGLGNFGDGTSTNDTTPTLNGTVSGMEPSDVIHIYEGTTLLGTATLNGSGGWTFTVPETTEGSHTYTAVVVDLAGNQGVSDSLTLIVDTTPPIDGYTLAIVNYTDDVAPGLGNFGPGTSTNDTTPTLNGTVTGMQAGDYINIYEGTTLLGTATLSGSTGWSFTVPQTTEGSHTYTAMIVDGAGNEGIKASFTLVVDTTSPTDGYTIAIVSYTDDVAPGLGEFGSGTSTNDTTPTLNGTVSGMQTGDFINVYEGAKLLGTATLDGSGGWTFTVPAATEGSHTYTAKVMDAANNEGVSDSLTLIVDTTPPIDGYTIAITSYTDNVGAEQGEFGDGTTTDDTTPTLNGTVSGMQTGDFIRIYEGSTILGTASVSGGGWSFTVPLTSDGSHTYTAVIVDAAHNEGRNASLTLVVDTTPPIPPIDPPTQAVVIATGYDDVEPLVGVLNSGDSTNDPTPTLNGTISSALGGGEYVAIYRGGTEIGTATVTGTTWTFTPTSDLPAEGTYVYTAKVKDSDGLTGPVSNDFTLIYDITPPTTGNAVAITAYTDDVGA